MNNYVGLCLSLNRKCLKWVNMNLPMHSMCCNYSTFPSNGAIYKKLHMQHSNCKFLSSFTKPNYMPISGLALVLIHPVEVVTKSLVLRYNSSLNYIQPRKRYKIDENLKKKLLVNKNEIQKNMTNFEAPAIHYARPGLVIDLQEATSSKYGSKKTYNDITKASTIVLNDLDVVQQIQNSVNILYADYKEVDKCKIENKQSNLSPKAKNKLNNTKLLYRNLPSYYASLGKYKLTGLVVLTSMAGYALAPSCFDPTTFALCSLGTAFTSCSANAINQVSEASYDALMPRTQNRVLVRGLLTPLHAITFGTFCGGAGISLLFFGVNELTAVLGVLNLVIYTSIYTPLKQMSIINTWVGSIVGAIPPMMGWVGCTGSLAPGAFIISAMLYAWQFPHFNALSWNIRHDYLKAGYKMMALSHPDLCRRTALKYSAVLIVLSTLAPICDVTSWTFALDSLPLNLYFTYLAWKFYKDCDSRASRRLFRFSLFHLPALLMLMLLSKKEPTSEKPQNYESLPNSTPPVEPS